MDGHVLFFLTFVFLAITATSESLRRQKRIVGGIQSAPPPEDDPVVFVNRNNRNARVIGTRDPKKGFYVFRGIRFGEPPVGRSRFQRPRPVRLEGEYNATSWGPPCPQPSPEDSDQVIGVEDCLYLNVFTPALPDAGDGYPVLIWIHGGGFRIGAACQYEMRNLIKKKMVVVSIQYRLGSLGFLSTGTKELPGNNGMFDMVLAVDWVKNYIGYFGGDPKKIVAIGHGSGAASALMLSLSKLTKSYFSGLIAMSGSVLSHFAVDKDPLSTAKTIASSNGCPIEDVPEMVRCLQELPVEKLVAVESRLARLKSAAQGFISGISNLLGPGPVIEGSDDNRYLPNFMSETPESALKLGNFPKIPLLTGVVKDETGGAITGKYKKEIEGKLQTVKNFLNKDLVESLQSKIPVFGNQTQRFVPEEFGRYLETLGFNGNGKDVRKVAGMMDDALFNAPAFLTAQHWSNKAKAFLYSFDHQGKRHYGKNFLAGLPIIDAKNPDDDTTGHGDDLGYVFDRNTIFGKEIPDDPKDEEDDKVTEAFTDMVANFARSGDISSPATKAQNLISAFSPTDNSFVSITSKPESQKNFRYCEMALWTGLTERLQSTSCNLYKITVDTVKELAKGAEQIVDVVESPVTGIGNVVNGFVPAKSLAKENAGNQEKQLVNVPESKLIKPLIPKLTGLGLFG